jgi:hypothetical protein
MPKAKAKVHVEKPKHNWVAWGLGIGGAVVTAGLLWFIQFLVFGFEEYIEGIASRTYQNDGVPQASITTIETRLTGIEGAITAQATANEEFRREQREDMRNLVSIISRRATP